MIKNYKSFLKETKEYNKLKFRVIKLNGSFHKYQFESSDKDLLAWCNEKKFNPIQLSKLKRTIKDLYFSIQDLELRKHWMNMELAIWSNHSLTSKKRLEDLEYYEKSKNDLEKSTDDKIAHFVSILVNNMYHKFAFLQSTLVDISKPIYNFTENTSINENGNQDYESGEFDKIANAISNRKSNTFAVRLMLFYELGLYDIIKEKCPKNRMASRLISEILNSNPDTIKPYMSYLGSTENDRHNPAANKKAMADLETILKAYNMKIEKIRPII